MYASLELCGNHRGGADHSRLLLGKLQASIQRHAINAQLRDSYPGRAKELAVLYEREGIPVTAYEEDAPLESDATIRALAMDDVPDANRIVDQPVTNQVLEVGILAAVPTLENLGGSVIGFGATLTPTTKKTHQNTRAIFNQLAGMASERRSSRYMSAPILNSIQMANTRYQLHDRLTNSSLHYLDNGEVDPDLFVIEGLTRLAYPLVDVVETRRDMLRRELADFATHEIIPQIASTGIRRGVTFFDPREPWIFMILARQNGSRWAVEHAIELPVKALPPLTLPNIEPMPKSEPTFLEMLVTD